MAARFWRVLLSDCEMDGSWLVSAESDILDLSSSDAKP